MSEYEAEEVEDAVRTCVKEFEALCIANRVIETDCIYCDREPNETAYCNKWHKYLDNGCGECKAVTLADVVEVVRCKDCKHRVDYSDGDGWYCDVTNNCLMRDENFYCSYGERSEDDAITK